MISKSVISNLEQYLLLEILYQTVLHQVTSLCQVPNSQSQSPNSSSPILISPAPSPVNATIQNNNVSNNLYTPLEQQKNYTINYTSICRGYVFTHACYKVL